MLRFAHETLLRYFSNKNLLSLKNAFIVPAFESTGEITLNEQVSSLETYRSRSQANHTYSVQNDQFQTSLVQNEQLYSETAELPEQLLDLSRLFQGHPLLPEQLMSCLNTTIINKDFPRRLKCAPPAPFWPPAHGMHHILLNFRFQM